MIEFLVLSITGTFTKQVAAGLHTSVSPLLKMLLHSGDPRLLVNKWYRQGHISKLLSMPLLAASVLLTQFLKDFWSPKSHLCETWDYIHLTSFELCTSENNGHKRIFTHPLMHKMPTQWHQMFPAVSVFHHSTFPLMPHSQLHCAWTFSLAPNHTNHTTPLRPLRPLL